MDAQEPEPDEEMDGAQGEERRWRYMHDGVGYEVNLPPSHDRSLRRQMRIQENFRRSQARWALSIRRSPHIVNWAQYKPNDLEKIMETLMSFGVKIMWIEQVFIQLQGFLRLHLGGFMGGIFRRIQGYCTEGFKRSRSLQKDFKLLKDQLEDFRNQLEEVQVYVGPEAAGLDVADLSSIESSESDV
jgi:hypothetical protein